MTNYAAAPVIIADHVSDDPLITIIVPVYNVQEYLDTCIKSIVSQTYRNLEILLIDDGSTDRSAELCDIWAKRDPRIQVVHQSNSGAAHSRNVGLDIAAGELIGFVDSDDWIEPTMYEQLYRNLTSEHADLSIIGGQGVAPDGELRLPKQNVRFRMDSEEAFILANQPGYFGIAVWLHLAKRSLFNGLRFPENICNGEDYPVIYGLLDHASVIFYDSTPLYNHRLGNGGISSNVEIHTMELMDQMITLVSRKYPRALKQAEYMGLSVSIGMYDRVLLLGRSSTYISFMKEVRKRVRRARKDIPNLSFLSRGKRLQWMMLAYAPHIYDRMFVFLYKHIK
ncbi:glycosyl transferase family 2 [Bifidobacterium hapali]|uniref:Glycosyl transferase family 2 n=1 Tax=Bifidobacterium hapali TaxID=1630172 RepID=A0A261G432_9BIFI|nr:glycosyltransferase [Bifidobacterium hapali]OZG66170.1 glycosyl transferase family 2 [Bifidobacterium hapali]